MWLSPDKDKTVNAARNNGKQWWTNPQRPDGLCCATPLLLMLDLILMAESGIGIATSDHAPRLSSAPFTLAPFSSGQIRLSLDSPPPQKWMLSALVLHFQHYISKLHLGGMGKDEHQHSWHHPQPQREQTTPTFSPEAAPHWWRVWYRIDTWPCPHRAELYPSHSRADSSDRDSSKSQNLELGVSGPRDGRRLHLTKFTSKKEEKEPLVWQPSTLSISHLIYFLFCQNVPPFIPSDSHTPDKGWKHTVLTGTFWVWILWFLPFSILANIIFLASHWLCLTLSLQNLFSPHCLFSQDNRRKKIWIMKFSHINNEKYIKLTFCTSKDCNLSLAVLPLFPIAA